jgi:predicted enzyme related to lactoylglutathione lyase
LQGLGTTIYQVTDLAAAKAWYAQAIGHAPYFDQPFYVGFNVGGYELGLQADAPARTPVENVVAYWRVGDIVAEVQRLTGLGATAHSPVTDVGEGIRVAVLRDPWGNALGLIQNPHFAARS